MATRLGVDVGGTFSDLVVFDETTGEVMVAKGSTTPASPDEGVARVISEAVPEPVLRHAAFFLHGSTVALNALLERKGAVVGLLTTEGFRDVLELRRGDRGAMNDLLWHPPPALVPRRLRRGVRERVLADGTIDTPLREEDIARALDVFRADGVECIAVVFLHAYANPGHELAAEEALRRLGFTGEVSLSHRVSGEYHEYERTSTTVIDAYIRPRMSFYLRQLEDTLSTLGFAGSCMITSSGGGAMLFAEAEARPFESIMSGPVAGAVGAGELCRRLGLDRAVTADVGGTSFDTCLIRDGRPEVKYEGSVVGMPLQTPWVDVRSIGAGGGSVGYVDEGGLLRVGPRSAGAEPGPACYGRGGVEPTVTDAAASLGILAHGQLAGGVSLDLEAARGALEPLGEKLGLDLTAVAKGILTIVSANMANAIREVTIEQGEDPRDAALIAFGGAGPMFGTLLARELDISRVVVPTHAGNFSAWGLLAQDVAQTAAQTSISTLDDEGLATASGVLGALFARLDEAASNTVAGEPRREAALDMRFVGQEYTLTIPAESDAARLTVGADALRSTFMREYERTFGHSMDEAVEIVSVRATLRSPLPRRAEKLPGSGNGRPFEPSTIQAYSFTLGEPAEFDVVERESLGVGGRLAGPAIVLEPTATTYVDAGFSVEVDVTGTMFIEDGRT
jgi:N-methylhydantoinase A